MRRVYSRTRSLHRTRGVISARQPGQNLGARRGARDLGKKAMGGREKRKRKEKEGKEKRRKEKKDEKEELKKFKYD